MPFAKFIARLMARSGGSNRFGFREAAQWSEEVKKSRADAVIVNDADFRIAKSR
jgi:dephospho-CoA kinase